MCFGGRGGGHLPVNNLYAVGMLRFSETQYTSDLWRLYKPGSIITGLALWYLKDQKI